MRDRGVGLVVLVAALAGACQARTAAPVLTDGGVRTDGCSAETPAFPSNGVRLKPGTDPDSVTRLEGHCYVNTNEGTIYCVEGFGSYVGPDQFEVLPAVASSCHCMAGATPPSIAVFSFGSLEIAGGTQVWTGYGPNASGPFPNHAVALVAARTITIHGSLSVATGGFGEGYVGVEADRGPGPAPGFDAQSAGPGAGGAGGATVGAPGGAEGAPGGWALQPALEPLCGGSRGGNVLDSRGDVVAQGGGGGGALMLVAWEGILLERLGDFCAVFSYGILTPLSDVGGGGGGAGGASNVDGVEAGVDCNSRWPSWLPPPQAQQGGGAGPDGAPGGAGGALDPPVAGGDARYGGGGGGAAGFVFVRTNDCGALPERIYPPPQCSVLPSPLPPP